MRFGCDWLSFDVIGGCSLELDIESVIAVEDGLFMAGARLRGGTGETLETPRSGSDVSQWQAGYITESFGDTEKGSLGVCICQENSTS